MKKINIGQLFLFVIVLMSQTIYSQEIYIVLKDSILFYQPVGKIPKGMAVSVISKENPNWWKIEINGISGYVSSGELVEPQKSDEYGGWQKSNIRSGANPNCGNINEEFDDSLDNQLLVHVGQNADVVVKLMQETGGCSRIVYIKAGDTCSIKNIPEGVYYLKLAYGKDLYQSEKNGQCITKFLINPLYKIGEEKLDFNILKKTETINNQLYNSWQIPSFELTLDARYDLDEGQNFNSNSISVEEFNK